MMACRHCGECARFIAPEDPYAMVGYCHVIENFCHRLSISAEKCKSFELREEKLGDDHE